MLEANCLAEAVSKPAPVSKQRSADFRPVEDDIAESQGRPALPLEDCLFLQ